MSHPYNRSTEMSPIPVHHSSIASASRASRPALSSHASHASASGNHPSSRPQSSRLSTAQRTDLLAIQAEIETLKERHAQLEMQRRYLKGAAAAAISSSQNTSVQSSAAADSRPPSAGPTRPSSAAHDTLGSMPPSPVQRAGGPHLSSSGALGAVNTSAAHRSSHSVASHRSARSTSALGPARDHNGYIATEKERRREQSQGRSVYGSMKEAMRQSWSADTTLVGGYFALEDNPKTGTFGRERRFMNPPGSVHYYLSTDVSNMQRASHRPQQHYSVANRGKSGCNVNSHWNDGKGGAAPGPGAYTPRYQKLAPPSILAQKMM